MFVVRGVLLRITILCLGGVFGAFLSCVVRGVLLRITILCLGGVFGAFLPRVVRGVLLGSLFCVVMAFLEPRCRVGRGVLFCVGMIHWRRWF